MPRLLILGLLLLPLSAANLIQNPGFEAPVVGVPFVTFAASNFIPGWTWAGPGSGLIVRTDYTENGFWRFPAAAGQNALDLTGSGWTGNNVVYQDVPTTIGQQYLLSFYLGNQDNNLGPYIADSTMEVLMNGSIFLNPSYGFNGGNSVRWLQFSGYYTATQTTTRIAFRNVTSSNDWFLGLDEVTFEAVPEPATTLPLAVAAALAITAQRRRRTLMK
jgi:hypothetical protein